MSMGASPNEIVFEDEALRDGLQMDARVFSLEEKIRIYQMLKEAGIKRIQVGSFVHPKIVPQMADTDELIQTIGRHHNFRWPKRRSHYRR